MLPRDREIQRALLWFAGDQARLFAVATFERGSERPHIQPAFDLCFVVAMAREALLMEERRDAAHEELLGIISSMRLGCRPNSEDKNRKSRFHSGFPFSKRNRISAPLSIMLQMVN